MSHCMRHRQLFITERDNDNDDDDDDDDIIGRIEGICGQKVGIAERAQQTTVDFVMLLHTS